jgi:hypothetical protein
MSFRFPTLYSLAICLPLSLAPVTASAYVGPGAGITAIGSVLALLVGVVLAIVGFVWYPLKRFLRSRSGKATGENPPEQKAAEDTRHGK